MMEKEYVTYRILMKQVGRDIVGVRHRYSEFEVLRNSLKEQYGHLGIAVPSLPPKTLLVSSTLKESFLRERTLGLTIFCEVRSPNKSYHINHFIADLDLSLNFNLR